MKTKLMILGAFVLGFALSTTLQKRSAPQRGATVPQFPTHVEIIRDASGEPVRYQFKPYLVQHHGRDQVNLLPPGETVDGPVWFLRIGDEEPTLLSLIEVTGPGTPLR